VFDGPARLLLAFLSLSTLVKVLDDDPDKHVEHEETDEQQERDKVEQTPLAVVPLRLDAATYIHSSTTACPYRVGIKRQLLLAICRPSGCTVASGIVGVVVVVGGGVCYRCHMRTSKCTCLIFGVSIGLDPG